MKKRIKNVFRQFSAIIWKEDNWYVAKCLEVEVASQGKTRKKALANLKEALELYFEDEPEFKKLPSYPEVSVEKINLGHA